MLYVMVITKEPLSEDCVSQAAAAIGMSLFVGADGTFHLDIDAPSRRIRIEPAGTDLADWEDDPEKLLHLRGLGQQVHVYAMHYKSVEHLRAALTNLAHCADYVLDDDYDLFVSGQEFTSLCRQNPGGNSWWLGGKHDVRYWP